MEYQLQNLQENLHMTITFLLYKSGPLRMTMRGQCTVLNGVDQCTKTKDGIQQNAGRNEAHVTVFTRLYCIIRLTVSAIQLIKRTQNTLLPKETVPPQSMARLFLCSSPKTASLNNFKQTNHVILFATHRHSSADFWFFFAILLCAPGRTECALQITAFHIISIVLRRCFVSL